MTEDTLFAPVPPVTVPVQGESSVFPVRRVFCVGRNYAAHAAEMGTKADKEDPFYFTKTALAIVPSGATIAYPPGTENYHYEMELVAAIGAPAFQVGLDDALACVFGYACGLDMTRRDLQLVAREKGRPWDLGKDFEESAVISPIVPASVCGHISRGAISLSVNGEVKQNADVAELINSVPEILVHLSRFYHLEPGDLIYTGTPAGEKPDVSENKITNTI